MASIVNPLMNGVANVGTDNGKYAREGHVHPSDTSLLPKENFTTHEAKIATDIISAHVKISKELPLMNGVASVGSVDSGVALGNHRHGSDSSLLPRTELVNNIRSMFNVISYDDTAKPTSVTGIMKITLPVSWTSAMMYIEIDGYSYSSSGAWKLILGGYNFTGQSWVNCTANLITGTTTPFNKVRFAHDGSKCCILLGEITTVWSFPQITVSKVNVHRDGKTLPSTGWTIGAITTETGLTNIATPTLGIVPTGGNTWNETNLPVESGTFTPNIVGTSTAGTYTYTSQIGTYNRIGKLIFFDISIAISGIVTAPTGNLVFRNLPMTAKIKSFPLTAFAINGLTPPSNATGITARAYLTEIHLYWQFVNTGSPMSNIMVAPSALTSNFSMALAGYYEIA